MYVLKRLVSMLATLFVSSVIIFLLIHLIPGDPASSILGMDATQADIDRLNAQLGLNEPLLVQYLHWLGNVLQGDLGYSFFSTDTVAQQIASHMKASISLALTAELCALALALPAGFICARFPHSILDRCISGTSLFALTIPSYVLGLVFILVFAVALRLFPVAGYAADGAGILEHLRYLVLPGLALGISQAALIAKMLRTSLVSSLDQGYVATARARGMREGAILLREVLKNCLIPLVTIVAYSFGALVTGAVVAESIFNIPGLGQLLINSIQRRDFMVIQGILLVITLVYMGINMLADLSYYLIDPRLRRTGRLASRTQTVEAGR